MVPDAEVVDQDEKTDQGKEKPQYVEIVDPFAAEISFLKSECPERKVIRVICDHLGEFLFTRGRISCIFAPCTYVFFFFWASGKIIGMTNSAHRGNVGRRQCQTCTD